MTFPSHIRYRPLPTVPPVSCDITLVVPDTIPAGQVEAVIRGAGGPLLESVILVSLFVDVTGARHLTWRLTFRHPTRTLRLADADGARERILSAVAAEMIGVRPSA